MSIAEILTELSLLSRDELISIAVQIDRIIRARKAVIYDDAYGIFTDVDQAALVVEAWKEKR